MRVGSLLTRRALRRFRRRVDYSEYGGAPLLGVGGVAIVGHGRSSIKAVRNAVAMAYRFAANDFIARLALEIEGAASASGGSAWGRPVRLSNLGSGAPYKTADGYTFTDGDYFGIAVSSTGVAHVIWGEADGSSLYCCGDTWYTKGS